MLLLTDRWCDWEASYAIAVANVFSDYVVKTIALDTSPKVSMGNLCVNIDYSIDDYAIFRTSERLTPTISTKPSPALPT